MTIMTMLNAARMRWQRLIGDSRGAVSLELGLLAPILIAVIAGTYLTGAYFRLENNLNRETALLAQIVANTETVTVDDDGEKHPVALPTAAKELAQTSLTLLKRSFLPDNPDDVVAGVMLEMVDTAALAATTPKLAARDGAYASVTAGRACFDETAGRPLSALIADKKHPLWPANAIDTRIVKVHTCIVPRVNLIREELLLPVTLSTHFMAIKENAND